MGSSDVGQVNFAVLACGLNFALVATSDRAHEERLVAQGLSVRNRSGDKDPSSSTWTKTPLCGMARRRMEVTAAMAIFMIVAAIEICSSLRCHL
jgi:hypothetical protein